MLTLATPTNDSGLARYPSCIVCGNARLSELAGARKMATEARHREDLFRDSFPPGTPRYMLKDRAYATQEYDARLLVCNDCVTLARDPHLPVNGSVERYAGDAYHHAWMESSH